MSQSTVMDLPELFCVQGDLTGVFCSVGRHAGKSVNLNIRLCQTNFTEANFI